MCIANPIVQAITLGTTGFLGLTAGKKAVDSLIPDIPAPPKLPELPQAAQAPDTSPLRRRNQSGGGFAPPAGSTLLTGPSGVSSGMLNLGSSSLLGG